jgi:hypothetical protein
MASGRLARMVGMGCVALASAWSHAAEVTVKNDSVVNGASATICPCFVTGEEAAVWLTSPCDGDIVAIQIFWRSFLGGSADVVEQAINVYEAGAYPAPGPLKKELLAPVLTDGVLNEYRFEDENQTIPISIPVTAGEEFVVALEFFNDSPALGPSIVFDTDGILTGKNSVFAAGQGWVSSESLGVSGDWFIRVVIDCEESLTGACCLSSSTCVPNVDEATCVAGDGVYLGNGSDCAGSPCGLLAGACCFPGGGCLELNEGQCMTALGTFEGIKSTCASGVCTPACPGDIDGDGDTDVFDFADLTAAFGTSLGDPGYNPDADLTGDDTVDVFDFGELTSDFGCGS